MFTITYKLFAVSLLAAGIGLAQPASSEVTAPAASPASTDTVENTGQKKTGANDPIDKRIFGVMPNYRTANASSEYLPLTASRKFYIATRDSFDWPGYLVGGAFASLYQLEDSNPSFGQGMKGYAHRYVTAYADQVAGNMMTEAILPSLLHEDPRYFRIGEGSGWKRARYAATRILITRTDQGGTRFNTSEVLGNAITASLANAYYPDNRTFSDTAQRLYTQLATDAFSNVMKEFWPDIKRKWFHK